jgi:hypothetical protein
MEAAMKDHPSAPHVPPVTPALINAPTAQAVASLVPYVGRWAINVFPGGLPVWTAEHHPPDGRHIRYVAAHSAEELAAKLETAETVEP